MLFRVATLLTITFSDNVGVGGSALQFVSTACYNVGLGSQSGSCISTGCFNVAVGARAMGGGGGSFSGNFNVAVGVDAGRTCLAGVKTSCNNVTLG
jgi:hypothetical protein